MVVPVLVAAQARSTRRMRGLRRNVTGYLYISPWIIGWISFEMFPLFFAFSLAFLEWKLVEPPDWVGLTNYKAMFSNELFYKSLYNTAYYSVLAVGLHLAAALLAALAVNQKIWAVNFYRFARLSVFNDQYLSEPKSVISHRQAASTDRRAQSNGLVGNGSKAYSGEGVFYYLSGEIPSNRDKRYVSSLEQSSKLEDLFFFEWNIRDWRI